MNDTKQKIIDGIEKCVEVFIKVSQTLYRIRCPFCGDSQKNTKSAHMYLKCSLDITEPILYYCHRAGCNAKGKLNNEFISRINLKIDGIDLDNQIYNRIKSVTNTSLDIITGEVVMNSLQVDYITKRLGPGFTKEDFEKFKIVWDMDNIRKFLTNSKVANSLPNNHNSVSFMSENQMAMLTRFTSETGSWIKTKMTSLEERSFYTIKSTIDIFSGDIIINIAEGIMDVLSLYKMFHKPDVSDVYLATLGSDYEAGLKHLIAKGFVGSDIRVNFFIDSDINERDLKWQLKKYKWIIPHMSIWKNIKSHDFGITADQIKLIEYPI